MGVSQLVEGRRNTREERKATVFRMTQRRTEFRKVHVTCVVVTCSTRRVPVTSVPVDYARILLDYGRRSKKSAAHFSRFSRTSNFRSKQASEECDGRNVLVCCLLVVLVT